jgi:hypothetical protein
MVPDFLTAQPRWVLWREVMRGNRVTKEPWRCDGSAPASSTTPQHWSTFAEVDAAFRRDPRSWHGTGIVLGPLYGQGEYLSGLDLDSCLDDGALALWARPFIGVLDTYWEVSPSGGGVKAFFRINQDDLPAFRHALGLRDDEWGRKRTFGTTPNGEAHAPAAELYISGRYFTVTGNRLPEAPEHVARLGPDALRRLADLMGRRDGERSAREWDAPRGNGPIDEAALRKKLADALRRSAKLAARWGGAKEGLTDATRSGFDMSLGAMLKLRGFSFAETRALLIANGHGGGAEKAADGEERYFERIWGRSEAEAPEDAPEGAEGASEQDARADAGAVPPGDGFVILRPSEWTEPPPPQEWIVKDWIPRGVVTGLYGDGGIGKTLIAQQLLTCVGGGVPWLGLETIQGRGFGMFCEDSRDELARRQCAINAALGVSPEDMANVVEYVSRIGADNLLMTFDGQDTGTLTVTFEALSEALRRFRPDLVVLDTAADLFGGNENARPQVRQFIQAACGRIALEFNCGVVLCAHPSVAGMQSGMGTGGSTAWNNTMRSRMYLTKPERENDDDPLPDPDARILSRKKANYARAGEEVELIWKNGVLRPPGGQARAAGAAPIPWETIDKVFDEIEAAWVEGKPFSHAAQAKSAARYLPDHMQRRHGVPLKRAAFYVREWISNGCLSIEMRDKHRNLSGLKVLRRPNHE